MSESITRLQLGPISPAAGSPLYQQIVDAFKREIAEGRLQPTTPLPSFRVLAEQLLVSLITVKRAYDELEREGIIRCHQGLGTFVSEDADRGVRATQRQAALAALSAAVIQGRHARMTDLELQEALQQELDRNSRQPSL